MRARNTVSALRIIMLALLLGTPASGWAQPANEWAPPLRPDGQPDIQGVWTNFDLTPFEVYDEVDLERLAPMARWIPGLNKPVPEPKEPDPNVAVEAGPADVILNRQHIDGPGRRSPRRRSMVVDPPTGRVPVRDAAVADRNWMLDHLTDSYLNHVPGERCITRGVPGSIFPGGYSAAYRILQPPGYVVILYEMIHEARIIPVGDRPHLVDGVRQWNGDSRGRWEGNTLVVEITNYNDKGVISTSFSTRGARGLAATEDLRVVERFTFAEPNRIDYDVTIEDPDIYTAPWTVAMPLNKDQTYLQFEYACHEGNLGIELTLRGARVEELAAESPR